MFYSKHYITLHDTNSLRWRMTVTSHTRLMIYWSIHFSSQFFIILDWCWCGGIKIKKRRFLLRKKYSSTNHDARVSHHKKSDVKDKGQVIPSLSIDVERVMACHLLWTIVLGMLFEPVLSVNRSNDLRVVDQTLSPTFGWPLRVTDCKGSFESVVHANKR